MNNGKHEPPDDLTVRVTSWLNKSGFPLEMRVAKAFKHRLPYHGWEVETNVVYTDSITGASRERDLIADTSIDTFAERGITVSIELFVECKATTTPWVILKESFDTPADARPLFCAFGGSVPRLVLSAEIKPVG